MKLPSCATSVFKYKRWRVGWQVTQASALWLPNTLQKWCKNWFRKIFIQAFLSVLAQWRQMNSIRFANYTPVFTKALIWDLVICLNMQLWSAIVKRPYCFSCDKYGVLFHHIFAWNLINEEHSTCSFDTDSLHQLFRNFWTHVLLIAYICFSILFCGYSSYN